MSSFLDKLKYQRVNSKSDSENEANDDDSDVNDENKKPVEKTALRGRAAALLDNLDDSDDSDDSDDNIYFNKNKAKTVTGKTAKSSGSGGGIYTMRINQTKQEKKNIDNKFNAVDKNLIMEKENECKNNTKSEKIDKPKRIETNDDESLSSIDDVAEESDSDSDSSFDNVKKKRLEREYSPIPASPPPPPSELVVKPKRKSTSVVDKQLKELELMKNKTEMNRLLNTSNERHFNNSDEDDLNTITVRVSTKNGLHKWEINENQPFKSIFENLAKIENTNMENLVLMLKDRIINFSDTPASINLKVYDIIDCGKATTVVQERIKIIENDEETTESSNQIIIILQTQDGRKSRMKFLIAKDEQFKNVLVKYCEKKNLEFNSFIMEFDGDKVNLSETPNDLDLDGGEIFDVRKSSKPAMEQIRQNKKNYEFDDDILIA